MPSDTYTVYWVDKQGEGIVAGPLADRGYAQTVIESFDAPCTVIELVPLHEWPLPNYVKADTVAYVEHRRAKVASSGGSRIIRDLADAIFGFAVKAEPGGSRDYLLSELTHDLCVNLQRSLDLMEHGWDAGTVDEWLRYIAVFVGQEME